MTTKKAQLGIIFLTILIDLIGFGIVIPILPLYAKQFHAGPATIGILMGTYSLMQFIFSPILGKISDRVGRRPVLLVSLIATSAGFAVMGFAQSLPWLFIARIIPGISGGNISTAQAYVADITSPEERSGAMGLIGAAFGLGFTLGPAIGGVLSHYSSALPFLFASGLALFNALLAFVRLPESLPHEHRSTAEEKAPISQVFRHGWHLPALMGAYFFSIAGFSVLNMMYPLFTNERLGFDEQKNGYLFAFMGFIGIVVQGGLLRRLLKKKTEKSLALFGVVLLIAGMAYLPAVYSLGPLLLASAVLGIGNSFVMPTLAGLASRSAERSWQGRVNGLMQSSGSLARFVGPMMAGQFLAMDIDQAGHPLHYYGRTACWVAAGVLVLALILTSKLPAKPITAEA
ncbi:MAG TPA: MFS transporter [Chthoniobacteraceae bacterium]|nr:MFS transporter [Chthoniobacteraceae bacterium]